MRAVRFLEGVLLGIRLVVAVDEVVAVRARASRHAGDVAGVAPHRVFQVGVVVSHPAVEHGNDVLFARDGRSEHRGQVDGGVGRLARIGNDGVVERPLQTRQRVARGGASRSVEREDVGSVDDRLIKRIRVDERFGGERNGRRARFRGLRLHAPDSLVHVVRRHRQHPVRRLQLLQQRGRVGLRLRHARGGRIQTGAHIVRRRFAIQAEGADRSGAIPLRNRIDPREVPRLLHEEAGRCKRIAAERPGVCRTLWGAVHHERLALHVRPRVQHFLHGGRLGCVGDRLFRMRRRQGNKPQGKGNRAQDGEKAVEQHAARTREARHPDILLLAGSTMPV